MPNTNAVALKFWPMQPTVWFVQAELQFALHNITDDVTKYYNMVAVLDHTTAGQLVDIPPLHPPTVVMPHYAFV